MSKKIKYKITKEQCHNIKMGIVRSEQKDAGFFDGRFVARTQEDKSKYSRKTKHKNV
jgi:hypothetical protein